MSAVSIQSFSDHYVVTIPRSVIDMDSMTKFLKKIDIEEIAQEVDFSEEVVAVGEEIASTWWATNKESYLAGTQ